MKHPQTLIVSKETASQMLLRNTHLPTSTFNSDCRTIDDYQTFNTTLDILIKEQEIYFEYTLLIFRNFQYKPL